MKKLYIILLGYVICFVWVFLAGNLINYLGYPYEEEINTIPVSLQYSIFYTCIFAPLWEEAAYRYAPITIAKNLGQEYIFPTIIAVSCLFGWGHHNNPESVLIQGTLGFIFSIVYIRTGYSYWSSVILHSMYNSTLLILELYKN